MSGIVFEKKEYKHVLKLVELFGNASELDEKEIFALSVLGTHPLFSKFVKLFEERLIRLRRDKKRKKEKESAKILRNAIVKGGD